MLFSPHIMMESLSPQEENIIKDITKSFQTKKTIAIKDRILKDIKTLFEHEEEQNYLKPVRTSNFWNNNYIEYKIKGDKIKNYQFKNILIKLDYM